MASSISPLHLALGQAIRARRVELAASQEAMALSVGLNAAYWSGVERGERNLALTSLAKFAVALDTSVSALFSEAERTATADSAVTANDA